MCSSSIRVGVIGAGRMSQRAHIPNLLAEGCHVVAIADPRVKTARLVAEHFHIPHVYGDAEDLLARADVDAVAISVPDPFHAPVALAALQAGKHVFVEKPLTTNSTDGQAMVKAARRAEKTLMVGYQRRHDPAAAILKGLMDRWTQDGRMGALRLIRYASFGGQWDCFPDAPISAGDVPPAERLAYQYPAWLPEEYHAAYGAFNNYTSHAFDLLRFLVGPPCAVLAAYPQRPVSTVVLDWAGARAMLIDGPVRRGRWEEWYEFHYEHGWARLATPPALLVNLPGTVEVYYAHEGRREVTEAPYEWAFRREIRHFIRCIREDIPESPTPEEALATLRTVEAVFRQALQMSAPLALQDEEGEDEDARV